MVTVTVSILLSTMPKPTGTFTRARFGGAASRNCDYGHKQPDQMLSCIFQSEHPRSRPGG